jgi:chromosome segregation ATPase
MTDDTATDVADSPAAPTVQVDARTFEQLMSLIAIVADPQAATARAAELQMLLGQVQEAQRNLAAERAEHAATVEADTKRLEAQEQKLVASTKALWKQRAAWENENAQLRDLLSRSQPARRVEQLGGNGCTREWANDDREITDTPNEVTPASRTIPAPGRMAGSTLTVEQPIPVRPRRGRRSAEL